MWNNLEYEENMYYFNNVSRVSYYNHSIRVKCLDHCYDCAADVYIIGHYLFKYFKYTTKEQFWANISEVIKNIAPSISKTGRTLCTVVTKEFEERQFSDTGPRETQARRFPARRPQPEGGARFVFGQQMPRNVFT